MKKEITFKELISLGYKEKSIKEEIQSNMLTRIKSGKDVFNWVWGRMVIGGVVIFDDYGGLLTNGISRLVDDEYVKKDRIVFHNLNGHALMVKVL